MLQVQADEGDRGRELPAGETVQVSGVQVISLTLPWPPSVNRMWRTPSSGKLAGRTLLSREAREYRELCRRAILVGQRGVQPVGRLAVNIEASPPDNRRRDLDNTLKAVLDSLQHCGVIRDDADIDALGICRKPVVKGGQVKIEVQVIEGGDPVG